MKDECKLAQKISFMHAIDHPGFFYYLFRKGLLLKSLKIFMSPLPILGLGERDRPVLNINDY
jgi:hypothetical protein